MELERPILRDVEWHLDEPRIDLDLVGDRACRLERAPKRTRIDGGRPGSFHALRQTLRLGAAERAERWVLGLLHVLVAVRVPDEPDLGDPFDADQERRLERLHGPADLLGPGCHG